MKLYRKSSPILKPNYKMIKLLQLKKLLNKIKDESSCRQALYKDQQINVPVEEDKLNNEIQKIEKHIDYEKQIYLNESYFLSVKKV